MFLAHLLAPESWDTAFRVVAVLFLYGLPVTSIVLARGRQLVAALVLSLVVALPVTLAMVMVDSPGPGEKWEFFLTYGFPLGLAALGIAFATAKLRNRVRREQPGP